MVITGIYYAVALIFGGLIVSYFTRPAFGVPLYILALFCLYFFRDPDRKIPPGAVAVAPADGKVVGIVPDGRGHVRISIFLNIFDVHINRAPIAGKITSVRYKKGDFLVASKEEASARNEQNEVTVEGDDGTRVVFKQIAGLIARRIVFNKKAGDRIEKGERVGMIKFGSRTDLVLGPEWEVLVQEGNHVKGGASIMAKRRLD